MVHGRSLRGSRSTEVTSEFHGFMLCCGAAGLFIAVDRSKFYPLERSSSRKKECHSWTGATGQPA